MECSELTNRLWEYLDGELAAEEAAALDRHLDGCPYCRPRYCCDRAFLALLVRSLGRPCGAPPELRRAVRVRLARAGEDR